MRGKLLIFLLLVLVVAGGFVTVRWYSYIFAREVKGRIVKIDRVNSPTIITQGNAPVNPQMFSFAVAIQEQESREIVTASSEDRQWAVAQPGQCAVAKYFPYAPWDLDKAGTYHGARLLKLHECPPGTPAAPPAAQIPSDPPPLPPTLPPNSGAVNPVTPSAPAQAPATGG